MTTDAALASERTQLAWQRFSLSLAVVGALALRAGVVHGNSVVGFAAAAVLGALAFVLMVAGPRMRGGSAIRLALAATLVAAASTLGVVLALD